MKPRLLEVIACTVQDAVEAEAGGAGRIELVRDLERGGMTPALSLVKEVLAAVSIPVRAMLRETVPHEVNRREDRAALHDAARRFAPLGLDGIVLGFLRDGRVDRELMESLLQQAGDLNATFHRAFEETNDPHEAIVTLKAIPRVDRILTSGATDALQKAAAPEIIILAGGGIDRVALENLAATTGLREFHAGRAARNPPLTSGAVDRKLVKELADALARV